jgi:hypothetical protein
MVRFTMPARPPPRDGCALAGAPLAVGFLAAVARFICRLMPAIRDPNGIIFS